MSSNVEETRPLYITSGRPSSYAPPRRPSPLSPFSNADRSKPPVIRGISEESRALGASSPTQSSAPSSRSDSTASSEAQAPGNLNSSSQPLLHARSNAGGNVPRPPSMILYHLALPTHASEPSSGLAPPRFSTVGSKNSTLYSRDSVISMSTDSKYPLLDNVEHGYVPYAYDPLLDDDEEELVVGKEKSISWRGFMNMGALVFILVCLLVLFVAGPVLDFARRNDDYYGESSKEVGAKVPVESFALPSEFVSTTETASATQDTPTVGSSSVEPTATPVAPTDPTITDPQAADPQAADPQAADPQTPPDPLVQGQT